MPQFHPDNSRTLEQWADEIHTTIGEIMPEVKTKEEYAESFLSGGVDSSYVLAMSDVETTDSCGYDEERCPVCDVQYGTAAWRRVGDRVCHCVQRNRKAYENLLFR